MDTGYSDENLPDAVNVDIGISVSLIVAIAVVIGALILTIGLVCFKRSVLIEFVIQELQNHRSTNFCSKNLNCILFCHPKKVHVMLWHSES